MKRKIIDFTIRTFNFVIIISHVLLPVLYQWINILYVDDYSFSGSVNKIKDSLYNIWDFSSGTISETNLDTIPNNVLFSHAGIFV